MMAKELVDIVRKNVTVDWTLRDNVKAKLRVLVKRLLRNTSTRQICSKKPQTQYWIKQNCCKD
jgi:hypothetical protein